MPLHKLVIYGAVGALCRCNSPPPHTAKWSAGDMPRLLRIGSGRFLRRAGAPISEPYGNEDGEG